MIFYVQGCSTILYMQHLQYLYSNNSVHSECYFYIFISVIISTFSCCFVRLLDPWVCVRLTYVFICVCVCTCLCDYVFVCMYVCNISMHACMYICMWVFLWICMYACIRVLTNMHCNICDLLRFSNNGLQCIGSALGSKFTD